MVYSISVIYIGDSGIDASGENVSYNGDGREIQDFENSPEDVRAHVNSSGSIILTLFSDAAQWRRGN